jgi:hypothetical protein
MNAIELAPNIFRPKSNLFQPRNNWGLIALNGRKNSTYYDFKTFLYLLKEEIKKKTGIDPYEETKYRGRERVVARQLLMVMLRKHTQKSLHYIGKQFNKDHATVIYAIKTISNLYETDKVFLRMYREIDQRVSDLSKKLRD